MRGYTLTLHAYRGMAQPVGDAGMDVAAARQAPARLLRRRRREDFPIITVIYDAPRSPCQPPLVGAFCVSHTGIVLH